MSICDTKVGDDFYAKGIEYWSQINPTIDGMLGGFTQVATPDIRGSRRLLSRFMKPLSEKSVREKRRALDCGCGIGRVTNELLLDYAHTVDLLDATQAFLDEAKNYLGPKKYERIGHCFCSPLHSFTPPKNLKYDLIWCQWVTGHLTDKDFVAFLEVCKEILKPDGLIVIKDNTTSSDESDDDMKDSSVTRPRWLYLKIFQLAGLRVVADTRQTHLPKELYPVRMFALRDDSSLLKN